MESELEHLPSYSFDKEHLKRQLEIVKRAADLAKDKIDYDSAHNEAILLAIRIVEDFLRKKRRICYGGQAINAYLPKEHKFYDPEYSIPDYDFFTPSQNQDVRLISEELFKAGFVEVSAREGMHEGTIKLYVNFIPVADLTAIDGRIYKTLSARASKIDGITYIDPNSLRMLMYLELSRPRGEVTRWEKVYERLVLFNEFVPLKYKRAKKGSKSLTEEQTRFIMRYIIQNERMFAGGDLVPFYDHAVNKREKVLSYLLDSKRPILFYSNEPSADASQLRMELQLTSKQYIKTKVFYNQGLDVIPSIHVLHVNKGKKLVPLVFIIEQTACHSYLNLPITDTEMIGAGLDHHILRIASMDTLITLYFSLGFVQNRFFDKGAMDSLANQLVDISTRARSDPKEPIFQFISIRCAGKQITLPSLIRAKLKRMTVKKKGELRRILQEAEEKYRMRFLEKSAQKAQDDCLCSHCRRLRVPPPPTIVQRPGGEAAFCGLFSKKSLLNAILLQIRLRTTA